MKIAIRGGHNPGVPGAHGILDEVTEDRKYYKAVMNNLLALGHAVLDVTPGNTVTSGADLTYGVNKANAWGAELFVSCHVNAAGGAGTEVIYAPGSTKGQEYATKVNQAIAALGFKNRGAYADVRGLYEIKNTKMPCIILEPFFCDNQGDVDLYRKIGPDALGKAIAEGICGQKVVASVVNKAVAASPATPAAAKTDNMTLYIQKTLNRLSVSVPPLVVDGIPGAKTKMAVIKFQDIVNINMDGVPGSVTQNAINDILLKPVMRIGNYNRNATRYLQWRLGIRHDGIYGNDTTGAVKTYQGKNGLVADGIIGNATWSKLIN